MDKEELIKQIQELEKVLEAKKAEIESLKQRLIEKDARIEELEGQFAYECECNKQFVECQKENEELKQQLKDLQEKYEDRKQFCIREVQTLLNIINSLLYDNSQEQLKNLQEKEKVFSRGEEK